MPLPSRSRSLRQPGFSRGQASMKNPPQAPSKSSLQVEITVEEHANLKARDKQLSILDVDPPRPPISPPVPCISPSIGGGEVHVATANAQLDAPYHKGNRSDQLRASHHLPGPYGLQESTRRGEAGATAKSAIQLNSTRISSLPPSQTLKRSVSLRQPENRSTALPPRSRAHARQGSMMAPVAPRPFQQKMEVQDNTISLNPETQIPTSSYALHSTTRYAGPPGSHPNSRPVTPIESSLPAAPIEKSIDPEQSARMEQIGPPSAQRHLQEKNCPLPGATRHGRSTSRTIEGLQRAWPGATDPSSKPNKPQFSTYQQHFSPRKPSSMHKGQIGPSNRGTGIEQEAVHTDLYSLQNELLHLHLLYDASCRTRRAWEVDTECRLHQRFDTLASNYQRILEAESNVRLTINDQAVEAWCDGGGLELFGSKVRALSRTIQELSELSRPNGPYAAMVVQFAESLHQEQMNATDSVERFHINMEDLGRKWGNEMAVLRRKLDRCLRTLDNMGESSARSSLWHVLARHRDLAKIMIQELDTMNDIHREAFRIEQEQRATAIRTMVADEDGLDGKRKYQPRKAHVAAWR